MSNHKITRRGFLQVALGAAAVYTAGNSKAQSYEPQNNPILEQIVRGAQIDYPDGFGKVTLGGLRALVPTSVESHYNYLARGQLHIFLDDKPQNDSLSYLLLIDGFNNVVVPTDNFATYPFKWKSKDLGRIEARMIVYDKPNNPQIRIYRTNEEHGAPLVPSKDDKYHVELRWKSALTHDGQLFYEGSEPPLTYSSWVPSVSNNSAGRTSEQLVSDVKQVGLTSSITQSKESPTG